MSELEQVSKEMMGELDRFRKMSFYEAMNVFNAGGFPELEYHRSAYGIGNDYNVFLKIIKHINGEPQFEAGKPKKWIVRTKDTDNSGGYWYLIDFYDAFYHLHHAYYDLAPAVVKFNTRKEAEKWTNPQTEVVEVEE